MLRPSLFFLFVFVLFHTNGHATLEQLDGVRELCMKLSPDLEESKNEVELAFKLRNLAHQNIYLGNNGTLPDKGNLFIPVRRALTEKDDHSLICQGMAYVYLTMLRAFNIQARFVGMFDEFGKDKPRPNTHATVEILAGINWIASCPTFNLCIKDSSGRLLSFAEAREVHLDNKPLFCDTNGFMTPPCNNDEKRFRAISYYYAPLESLLPYLTHSVYGHKETLNAPFAVPESWNGLIEANDGYSANMLARMSSPFFETLAQLPERPFKLSPTVINEPSQEKKLTLRKLQLYIRRDYLSTEAESTLKLCFFLRNLVYNNVRFDTTLSSSNVLSTYEEIREDFESDIATHSAREKSLMYLTVLKAFGISSRYVGLYESSDSKHPFGHCHSSVEVFIDGLWLVSDPVYNFSLRSYLDQLASWSHSKLIDRLGQPAVLDSAGYPMTDLPNVKTLMNFIVMGPSQVVSKFNVSSKWHIMTRHEGAQIDPKTWDGIVRSNDSADFDALGDVNSGYIQELSQTYIEPYKA